MRTINVGVLGATGTVGQRFILLLGTHPYFRLHALGASARSVGHRYSDITAWKQTQPIPVIAKDLIVQPCSPEHFKDVEIVFSGLDAEVAGGIELAFRHAGFAVFSNAKNHRRDPTVPLIVPLVNTSHLAILPYQQSLLLDSHPNHGFIVTNANCAATGCAVPLAALQRAFGPIESAMITTMQAISGAGYPGVPSMDIFDNVIPYIGGGEEDKLEWELSKILGDIGDQDGKVIELAVESNNVKLFVLSGIRVSAACNRVPVLEGHTECVSVRFARRPAPKVEDVIKVLKSYTCEAQSLKCPSAPKHALIVHDEQDRPQPRLDRDVQSGAGVSVGRVRECKVMDIKFVLMANNVAIGAATSSLINAEVAVEKGYIHPPTSVN
ncbi:hypothetical protein Clacol_001206 [Clathrus columnatus]|uniref:Aspartate-semialdehyde dehydrogenase n=1 Tax=Clathrus columnatus TaxID=1419009 RepID=A0AAV5A0L7_9AGAM|nr:hypothetical protein Clacol_001206 [Clathrus columnatus]